MTQYARLILPELAPSTRPEKLLFDDAELIPEYPVRVVPNGSNVVVVLSPPRKNPAENTSPAAAIADPITVEEVESDHTEQYGARADNFIERVRTPSPAPEDNNGRRLRPRVDGRAMSQPLNNGCRVNQSNNTPTPIKRKYERFQDIPDFEAYIFIKHKSRKIDVQRKTDPYWYLLDKNTNQPILFKNCTRLGEETNDPRQEVDKLESLVAVKKYLERVHKITYMGEMNEIL
jgi:hypothetical protein